MWRRGRRWRGCSNRWRSKGYLYPGLEQIMYLLTLAQMEPRHSIIELLSSGEKTTSQIYQHLRSKGYSVPRTTLYYHLSELERAGIIIHKGYRETGGGAPEKIWGLKLHKICVNMITGSIEY